MFHPYTHRDMCARTGNQLAAVTTTIDTDPAQVDEGYVRTTTPATGDAHGQIALTTRSTSGTIAGTGQCSHITGNTPTAPVNPAGTWPPPGVDATLYALVCGPARAPQELINPHHRNHRGTHHPNVVRQTCLVGSAHQPAVACGSV